MTFSKKPSKDTLYVFPGSIWASAPWLAVYTLGLQDKVDLQHLNLIEGNNFDPEFVRITPAASLPTLVTTDGTVYGNTKTSVEYLIKNAVIPAGKSTGSDLIEKSHADLIDPNFAFLGARSDAELDAKRGGPPGDFVRNRQAKLEKFAPTAPDLKDFYDAKFKLNGLFSAVYAPDAPSEVKQTWFKQSAGNWEAIGEFIFTTIPPYLPESGFIGGDKPGGDDFHLMAWVARIALLTGGTPDKAGVKTLSSGWGGKPVPEKLVKYWDLWTETEAWKQVYVPYGLH